MAMRCIQGLCLVLGLSVAGSAAAATRTWPGNAPCAGTLQACIDASAAGDEVLIATATEIDENIDVDDSNEENHNGSESTLKESINTFFVRNATFFLVT